MATVSVARISSCTGFRSTTPNLTPMDCNRSTESWKGARGVSFGGGAEPAELGWTGCGAEFDAGVAGCCLAADLRALHQIPPNTPMNTTFATSPRKNALG